MIRAYAVADYSAAYPVMRGNALLLTAAASVGVIGEVVVGEVKLMRVVETV